MRINLPAGGHPTAVAFVDDASSVVVGSQSLTGASLYMYGEDNPKGGENRQHFKPELKWEQHNVHDKKYILTLFGTKATHGAADGSTIIASSSEGIYFFEFFTGYYLIEYKIELSYLLCSILSRSEPVTFVIKLCICFFFCLS